MPLIIKIIGIGHKNELLSQEVERYIKLVSPFASLSTHYIKPLQGNYNNRDEVIQKEETLLSKKWGTSSYPVALTEEGKTFTSKAFSQWMSQRVLSGVPVIFTIGGAFGLSRSIKRRCKDQISLSQMTLPHKLCAVVLVEQIYRAFTILHKHPYHK